MKKTLFAALLIVLMASCAKQEQERPAGNPLAIVFGSSIEASTRAGIPDDAEDFSENDQIGVLGYRKETVGAAADFATPFLKSDNMMGEVFTYNADKKFKSASEAAFFHRGKAHDFYAYHPHNLPINTLTAAAPTATLSVISGTGIGIDVMHAKSLATSLFNGRHTTNLAFTHRLSKVKFKIKKEANAPATVLSGIEFAMGKNSGSFDLTTGAITGTAAAVTLTATGLNQTVNTGESQAIAAAWYVLPDDALSNIKVTINGQLIATTATGNITTAQGKIRLITITVKEQSVEMTSSIEPWVEDNKEGEVGGPAANSIIYNRQGAITTDMRESTQTSYNSWKGVVGGDNGGNGDYQATEEACYTNEKPYYQFEVAMENEAGAFNWADARKACFDKNTDGGRWRLPRLSELKIMYLNKTALEGLDDFNAFDASDGYWSATEYANVSWHVRFANGIIGTTGKLNSGGARCVREL